MIGTGGSVSLITGVSGGSRITEPSLDVDACEIGTLTTGVITVGVETRNSFAEGVVAGMSTDFVTDGVSTSFCTGAVEVTDGMSVDGMSTIFVTDGVSTGLIGDADGNSSAVGVTAEEFSGIISRWSLGSGIRCVTAMSGAI
jgi:cysteine synthase